MTALLLTLTGVLALLVVGVAALAVRLSRRVSGRLEARLAASSDPLGCSGAVVDRPYGSLDAPEAARAPTEYVITHLGEVEPEPEVEAAPTVAPGSVRRPGAAGDRRADRVAVPRRTPRADARRTATGSGSRCAARSSARASSAGPTSARPAASGRRASEPPWPGTGPSEQVPPHEGRPLVRRRGRGRDLRGDPRPSRGRGPDRRRDDRPAQGRPGGTADVPRGGRPGPRGEGNRVAREVRPRASWEARAHHAEEGTD